MHSWSAPRTDAVASSTGPERDQPALAPRSGASAAVTCTTRLLNTGRDDRSCGHGIWASSNSPRSRVHRIHRRDRCRVTASYRSPLRSRRSAAQVQAGLRPAPSMMPRHPSLAQTSYAYGPRPPAHRVNDRRHHRDTCSSPATLSGFVNSRQTYRNQPRRWRGCHGIRQAYALDQDEPARSSTCRRLGKASNTGDQGRRRTGDPSFAQLYLSSPATTDCTAGWYADTERGVEGLNNTNAGYQNTCIPDNRYQADTDVLVVRHVDPAPHERLQI